MSPSVDVDIAADFDLLGKVVGDLEKDIVVNGKDSVSGTLHYVTGYTGFSGDPAEQEGHYIALHVTHPTADSIAVMLHGGTVGHPVTLDEDGIAVVRIADPKTQKLEFIATKSGVTSSVTLELDDLVLEPEE